MLVNEFVDFLCVVRVCVCVSVCVLCLVFDTPIQVVRTYLQRKNKNNAPILITKNAPLASVGYLKIEI